MEMFKAVEKEMKTKAYSKEGLQASQKLDPKEREKVEMCDFLSNMVDELGRQVEQNEAEEETLNAGMKKGKKDTSKADRIAELQKITERHKWHQSKLELVLRTLENGGLEVEHVRDVEEDIKYYVENNNEVDFMENDTMYDDLELQEEEDVFGVPNEMDRVSSHDAQSLADDTVESESTVKPIIAAPGKPKSASISETNSTAARRPSTQLKSPLPALATLHTPGPTTTTVTSATAVKPAPPPARAAGEPLKYASAAAAAAASDKMGLGLLSLPPPSREVAPPAPATLPIRVAPSVSPSASHPQPVLAEPPAVKPSVTIATSSAPIIADVVSQSKVEVKKTPVMDEESKKAQEVDKFTEENLPPSTPSLTNGDTHSDAEEEESIYHLPSTLSDLLESFESTKSAAFQPLSNPTAQRLFLASGKSQPDNLDSERPQLYKPQNPYPYTPGHYPQEPLPIFEDHRLYSKCDTDTLFYSFYYKQGTYQQYAAAKALKSQSWRFHKQYQTWFQRHEEPKDITEDFEQGTYRFFDYESTWLVQSSVSDLNPWIINSSCKRTHNLLSFYFQQL
jgi:CCR4-NOT transcription complex subunit 3